MKDQDGQECDLLKTEQQEGALWWVSFVPHPPKKRNKVEEPEGSVWVKVQQHLSGFALIFLESEMQTRGWLAAKLEASVSA